MTLLPAFPRTFPGYFKPLQCDDMYEMSHQTLTPVLEVIPRVHLRFCTVNQDSMKYLINKYDKFMSKPPQASGGPVIVQDKPKFFITFDFFYHYICVL